MLLAAPARRAGIARVVFAGGASGSIIVRAGIGSRLTNRFLGCGLWAQLTLAASLSILPFAVRDLALLLLQRASLLDGRRPS